MKHCLLAIILMFSGFLSFGQEDLRELSATPKDEHGRFPFWRCATVEVGEALRKEHPKLQSLDEFESFIQKANSLRKSMEINTVAEEIYYIPVVVHIIHSGGAVGEGSNISYAQVLSQIEALNEDFRRMEGSRGFNDHPDGADTHIEFVLADIAPDGTPLDEIGVHRVRDTDLGVSGTLYVDQIEAMVKPATIWDPNRYLNMWTVPFDGGLLGYAQFPVGSGLDGLDLPGLETGADTDGVVMDYRTFGSTDKGDFDMFPGYDKGRVTTHEVGHFLGLRHIWGDGGCGEDDYCVDTPESDGPNFSCPTGHVSCGTVDMIENYMDYSGDLCMNIFTQNQKERMYTVLEFSPRRKELLESDVISGGIAQANFVADKTTLYQGQQVQFTDRSRGNILSWNWAFEGGEPAISTAQNPVVTYLNAGVFQVSLTVGDEETSSEEIKPSFITVNQTTDLPTADFSADQTQIYMGQQVQFQDLSDETVYSWEWTFEGGEPASSSEQNPIVNYPEAGSFAVSLTVTNAQGTQTHMVENMIQAAVGPMVSVNPSSFSESMLSGEILTRTLSISNPGDEPLAYSLSSTLSMNAAAPAVASKINFPDKPHEKGKPDTRKGHAVTQRSGNDGGEYGYFWIDSQSAGGPTFDWIDISSTGSTLSLSDDSYQSLNLPFEFPFYDEAKSTIYVGSNGLLGFNPDYLRSFSNTQLPNTNPPNDLIAGYWTDLYPSGNVKYLATADYFIVQFTNVQRYGSSDNITFQYILYPNGNIKLQYLEINDNYNAATIGIENASGTSGMQIAFNTDFVVNNLAVSISRINPLSFAPASGEIAPGETGEVEVTIDAQDLWGGSYTGAIHISSNDPRHENFDVPVELAITGVPAIALDNGPIDFGMLMEGETNTQTLTLANTGTDELLVSIATDHEYFTANSETLTIAAKTSTELEITYSPLAIGEHVANLLLETNDPENPQVSIQLSGEGAPAPVISVDPEIINAQMMAGDSTGQILTVQNSGGIDLEYNIQLIRNMDQLRKASVTGKELRSSSTKETDITPVASPFTMIQSEDQTVLVIQDTWAWGIDMQNDVLTPMGINSYRIYSSEIETTDFNAFSTIITVGDEYSTDYYDIISSNASKFEEFARAGGVVIYQLATQGHDVTLAGGAVADYGYQESMNEVLDIDHPIVAGVPATIYGNDANHNILSNLPGNVHIITRTQDSQLPTTAEYTLGAGLVIATGMTWEYGYNNGYDYGLMMPNAIDYAMNFNSANGWLSVDNFNGSISGGSSHEVAVSLNARNLYGGTYQGIVRFLSNDPVQNTLDVPVTLEVEGTPAIELSANELHFNPILWVGQTDEQLLYIYNQGTDELAITSLSLNSDLFSLSTSVESIGPGQYAELVISFTSPEEGEFEAVLSIESNDPENGQVEVSLQAAAVTPPAYSVSENAFTASLHINEESELQSLVFSNEGGAPLYLDFFSSAYNFAQNNTASVRRAVGFYAEPGDASKKRVELPTYSNQVNTVNNEIILETYPDFIDGSTGMTWVNGELYVLAYNLGAVYKYNLDENVAVKQFDVPYYSYSMTWDGEYIWVTNWDTAYGYDLSGNMIGSFNLPEYDYHTLAWDGEAFLTARAFGGNVIYRIDETGEILNTFTLPAGQYADQLAVKGSTIWALDLSNYVLSKLDLSEAGVTITEQLAYPFEYNGYSLAIDQTGALWFADWYKLYKTNIRSMEIPEWLQAEIDQETIEIAGGTNYSIDLNFKAIQGMPVGQHNLELGLSTNDPEHPDASVSFMLEILNSAPTLELQAPDQSLVLDKDVYSLDLSPLFNDLNTEQTLSFHASASNDKVIATVEGNLMTVTPSKGGISTVSVYAIDPMDSKSESFSFTVTVIDESNTAPQANGAPEIGPLQQNESASFTLGDLFTDADGDPMTFTVSVSNPKILASAVVDNVLTLTALSGGEASVSILADDQLGGTAELSFSLTLNRKPEVAAAPTDQVLVIGKDSYSLNLADVFSDADGDILSYTVESSSEGVTSINLADGILSIEAQTAGTTNITLGAADDKEGSAQTSFTLSAHNAPESIKAPEAKYLQVGETISLILSDYFADADGDELSFTASVDDHTLLSAVVSDNELILNAMKSGEANVSILADDQRGGTAELSFNLTLNHKPEVAAAPTDQLLVIGKDSYSLNLADVFSDADGDILSYTVESSSEGVISINLADGILNIDALAAGTTNITLGAADDKEGSAQTSFTLSAHSAPAQREGQSLSAQVLQVGETITLNLHSFFSEADGDALSYEAIHEDGLVNAEVLGTVLEISGIAIGEGKVQIIVTDARGAQFSTEMSITVREVTALNDDELSNSFAMYPNPFTDRVNVKMEHMKPGKVHISIYDQQGREVESIQWEENTGKLDKSIDLSSKPAGLYLVKVMTPEGNTIKKLVKQ